ncbi:MAG: metal-dependent hydrolase [Gemmataceae bacterium]|nr:metal-dependent hydrolase [Gemmataceae bacterium]MDW8266153.1 metal-dependent hydrolase [Gemmataceae bacterium]
MASYRGHLSFSATLGIAYAGASFWYAGFDWGAAALGGILTTVGGLLPDLDSDSGVPVREMFGLAAVLVPCLLIKRLAAEGLNAEQTFVILTGVYLLVRFALPGLFNQLTVHRGMYHSIPAMFIAGLLVFLGYEHADVKVRFLLAGGVMLGFFSHLVLDEVCSVDFNGLSFKLNQYAGSALKLFSRSVPATLLTYGILGALLYVATLEFGGPRGALRDLRTLTLNILGPGSPPVRR